jgi:hypothetical protein
MSMTPEKFRKVRSVIKALDKLSARACELELKLGNGGEIDSMISAIALDLEMQLQKSEKGAEVRDWI